VEEDTKEEVGEKVKGKKKWPKKKVKKNRPGARIEYIADQLDLDPLGPMYMTFSKIFQAFKIIDPAKEKAM
jgi:hypothetical protein